MERLTETNNCIGFMETYLNIDCEECQFKNTGECEEYKDECRAVADFKRFVKDMYSKLKDYEDLEEQGLLLKIPCKIGDTIYVIPSKPMYDINIANGHEERNIIYEQIVSGIVPSKEGYILYTCGNQNIVLGGEYKNTWFLEKEEAKSALSELQR